MRRAIRERITVPPKELLNAPEPGGRFATMRRGRQVAYGQVLAKSSPGYLVIQFDGETQPHVMRADLLWRPQSANQT